MSEHPHPDFEESFRGLVEAFQKVAVAIGESSAALYRGMTRRQRLWFWLRYPRAARHSWQHANERCPCQAPE